MVSTVLALPAAVVAFWPWFAGVMEYPLARAVTVVGLALFAVFLYGLRHAKRITYGYGEVVVGVVGLWAALSRLDADRMAVGLGIAASVYVIVRGMVNIEDGRKAEREEEAKRTRTATTEESPGLSYRTPRSALRANPVPSGSVRQPAPRVLFWWRGLLHLRSQCLAPDDMNRNTLHRDDRGTGCASGHRSQLVSPKYATTTRLPSTPAHSAPSGTNRGSARHASTSPMVAHSRIRA